MSSKLREAVCRLVREIEDGMLVEISSKFEQDLARSLLSDVKSALAKPLRNCDVGTAEEQTTRYRKFCSAHQYLSSDFSYICKGFGKGRCPFSGAHTKSQCEFAWAQMPYKSEVK